MSIMRNTILLTFLGLLLAPSVAFGDDTECGPLVRPWIARCAMTTDASLTPVDCPARHVLLDAQLPGREPVRIDITDIPGEGFEQVGDFGVSVVGDFGDWSQEPDWIRAPQAAIVSCLGADSTLRVPTEASYEARNPERQHPAAGVDQSQTFLPRASTLLSTALVLLTLLVWVTLAVRARKDTSETSPAPNVGRKERFLIAGLVLAAVVIRLPLMAATSVAALELENFVQGTIGVILSTRVLPAQAVTPFIFMLLDGWLWVGDQLGVGGELLWLRLPNLALTVWLLLMFLRVGRLVGSREAGWAAAILFLLLPKTIMASICQGHYFVEAVFAAWFVERLATYLVEKRPVFASLAVAGALAMWAGHICLLVVAPGFLVFLVVAWRRKQRGFFFATALLFALVYGPLMASALTGALGYMGMIVTEVPAEAEALALEEQFHHNPIVMHNHNVWGFVSFPYRVVDMLTGTLPAVFALVAIVVLLIRRRWAVAYPLLVVCAFAFADTQTFLRWSNLTAVVPVLLFLSVWAVSAIPHKTRVNYWLIIFVLVALRFAIGTASIRPLGQHDPRDDWEAWLADETAADVAEVLQASENRLTPVLVLLREYEALWTLCEDRTATRSAQDCFSSMDLIEAQGGVKVTQMFARTVAQLEADLPAEQGGPCPNLSSLLSTEPWATEPFYVLSWKPLDDHAFDNPECMAPIAALSCEQEVRALSHVLSICQPPETGNRETETPVLNGGK